MYNKSNITASEYALYLGNRVQTFTRIMSEKGKPLGYKEGKLISVDISNGTVEVLFDDGFIESYYLNEVKLILKRFPTNSNFNPNNFKYYLKAGYEFGVLPNDSYLIEGETQDKTNIDDAYAKAHTDAILRNNSKS